MALDFTDILVSPEQLSEQRIIKEKQVVDGREYLRDQDGNVVLDSLGQRIEIDRLVTVRCEVNRFSQFKSVRLDAQVEVTDLESGQRIDRHPLSTEFVFEHAYADFKGDRRALDEELGLLLDLGFVPFPTDEDMVFEAGEELKDRLRTLLRRQSFN